MNEQNNQNVEGQNLQKRPSKSQIILAKELIVNFRFLLFALVIMLLYYIIGIIVILSKENVFSVFNDYLDILLADDIIEVSLNCFLISIFILVLGRYIYLVFIWVNDTYQASKPNYIPIINKQPKLFKNIYSPEKMVGIFVILSVIFVIFWLIYTRNI